MSCPNNSPRTFVLKLNLHCNFCGGCVKKVKEIVRNIEGVRSIDVDTEEGVATISGKVHPHTVIKELEKDKKIKAKLVGKEKDLSNVSKQKLQIGLSQNHGQKSLRVSQQLPAIGEQKAKTIRSWYPEHKHKLELKCYTKPFKCNRCKEEGFGKRYRCEVCNHDLHEECMFPKLTIIHELFVRRTFAFSQKLGNLCDACGRKIHGYSYSCTTGNFDLHPCCAKLRGKLCIGGTDFVLQKKAKGKCLWCKKKQHSCVEDDEVQGWCYVSVSKHDKFYCHVYCVSKMVYEAWKTGHLDRKDKVDDASMALERLDLKLGASLERSGWGVGTMFSKIVAILLKTVISTLLGDPTGLVYSLLAEVFAK